MLQSLNISYEVYTGVPLFAGATFHINPDDRIGLVGPNGCGKTSLLRLLAGEADPSAGRIILFQQPTGSQSARK